VRLPLAQRVYRRPDAARDQPKKEDHDRGSGPRVTVASDAIAVPDVQRNIIQLSMQNGITYEVGKDISEYFQTSGKQAEQVLEATKRNEVRAKPFTELDTVPLYRIAYHDPKLNRTRSLKRVSSCISGSHCPRPVFCWRLSEFPRRAFLRARW